MPHILISKLVAEAIQSVFQVEIAAETLQIQDTRKEFEGDYTLVVFPLAKSLGKAPAQIGQLLGEELLKKQGQIVAFNLVNGFLNLSLNTDFFLNKLHEIDLIPNYGFAQEASGKTVMVEYSSPNTNKPLHLGHLRNNFLGYALAAILKANGHDVKKVQIINDRGIHICKSMLAYSLFGNNEEPRTDFKGDKLVGKYYVAFDKQYKTEISELVANGMTTEEAEKKAPILLQAQAMLQTWEREFEAGKGAVLDLWLKMNNWVYEGFNSTYKNMGVDFDKVYYESKTYALGKENIEEGLRKGVFFKKEDNSVWVDLSAEGLDEKLLLRGDGTSVYITQDIGTAIMRFEEFPNLAQQIYTVGNEQEYHFKVLFLVLSKLGYAWAKECYHLSYGMVDLPSGKMKSREGTVVDADDLMDEMYTQAKNISEELGKLDEASDEEKETLYRNLGMGALKYYLLKVSPEKRMLFNPEESIDFNGNTGPFIQYTHARICSVLRKAATLTLAPFTNCELHTCERSIIKCLLNFPTVLADAGKNYSPALLANYLYELTKEYNHFYQTVSILKEENPALIGLRVALSRSTGKTLTNGMKLLGISVPERM